MQSRISFSHEDGSKAMMPYLCGYCGWDPWLSECFLLNILVPGFDPQSYIIDRDMELWSQLHRPMAGNGRYSLIVWSRSSSAKKWWSKAGNSKMGGWVWLKTWWQWTCKMCTILAYLVNLVIQFVGAPSAVGWLFLEPKASHRLATSIHTQIMQRLKVLTIISQQVASSTAQMPPLRTHATKIVKRKLLLVCSRFSVDPPKSGFFEVLSWQKEICRTNSCRTCAHFRSWLLQRPRSKPNDLGWGRKDETG